MDPVVWGALASLCLFVGMLGCLEAGYRLGRRKLEDLDRAHEGVAAMEAAVLALLGLLLAFSFAGATSRLDTKRQLIIQEANAIGAAFLRLSTLPAGDQPDMRRLFRQYLDARLNVYRRVPYGGAVDAEIAEAARLQQAIWSKAMIASKDEPPQSGARLLLLPALNEMFDVTTARTIGLQTHLPLLIFALLMSVALLSGLLAGYAMAKRRKRSWLHEVVYALVVALASYAIIDLDYPRAGWIRIDAADASLKQLRDSIR